MYSLLSTHNKVIAVTVVRTVHASTRTTQLQGYNAIT
jgi:hypothetical protein